MNQYATLLLVWMIFFSCNTKDNPSGNDKCYGLTNKTVCVTIINQSGHSTKKIILRHEKGMEEIAPLADNAKTTIVFNSPGENAYVLTVIFDNDDTLKSGGNYTEGGYRLTEVISKDSIQTHYDNFSYKKLTT